MRMCVIAQTPLISPFGSIGFRERKKGGGGGDREGGREGGGGGVRGYRGRREKTRIGAIFFKSTRNNNCTLNFRYKYNIAGRRGEKSIVHFFFSTNVKPNLRERKKGGLFKI